MIRPHKAPDSSCISRKLFLKILRSASVFRFSPSATIFLSIQALDERASRAITTLLPPYSQPNSHISWIGMLLRRERVEETIETVGEHVVVLSSTEGLEAHSESIRLRLEKIREKK